MTPAQRERHALADLMLEVGPDAPTLCGEWTTADLAAHLVTREHRPDSAIGLIVPAFADRTERVRKAALARPYEDLVATVRGGAPWWNPMHYGPVDALGNTVEYFVHHEDVRRAGDQWTPREGLDELEAFMWKMASRAAGLALRNAPGGVTFALPDGTTRMVKKGEPMVTVTGPVTELVLFMYGRQAKSLVTTEGPDQAVEALMSASLGV